MEKRSLTRTVQLVAAMCSRTIFHHRFTSSLERLPLLVLELDSSNMGALSRKSGLAKAEEDMSKFKKSDSDKEKIPDDWRPPSVYFK